MVNTLFFEENFRTFLIAALCVLLLLLVVTFVVLRVDPQLSTGAGSLLSGYVVITIFRDLAILKVLIEQDDITTFTVFYFECASIINQTNVIRKICTTVNSGLPNVKGDVGCQSLIVQILFALGITFIVIIVFVVTYTLILEYFFNGVEYTLTTRSVVFLSPMTLTTYNCVKCVCLALKVRAVRRATSLKDSHLHWQCLLLKIIFMSGVLSDLVHGAIMFLELQPDIHGGIFLRWLTLMWHMRGIEVFVVFICKKDVWVRVKNQCACLS